MLDAATESVGRRNRGLACITRAGAPGAPVLLSMSCKGERSSAGPPTRRGTPCGSSASMAGRVCKLGELLDEAVEAWLAEAKKTHNQGQDFPHRGRLR